MFNGPADRRFLSPALPTPTQPPPSAHEELSFEFAAKIREEELAGEDESRREFLGEGCRDGGSGRLRAAIVKIGFVKSLVKKMMLVALLRFIHFNTYHYLMLPVRHY